MSDVIREVLIRGRMEIVKADLAVPDITAFTKQLEAQNKLAQDQARAFDALLAQQEKREQQARVEDEANKQRLAAEAKAREERRKAAEEARKQREEAKRLADETAAAEKAAAEAAKKAEEERRKQIEETNKAREEAIRREKEITDSLLKGGDALKQAGDGAFAFARGLTLVGLEGDASLEKIARQVASVQAKFDLFRGSVDIIKGGTESFRAFSQALELSGGAAALLTSRLAGIAAFLGPTGLIVVGATAAAAAVVGVFQYMREDTESYVDDIESRLREFVGNAERDAAKARAAFQREDAIRDTLTGQGRIDAIRRDLDGVGSAASAAAINEQASKAFGELFGQAAKLSDEEFRARREQITTEKLAAFDSSSATLGRQQQLARELLSATSQRDDGANRERETAIQEAARKEEEARRDIARKEEELRRAQEQQAEVLRQQAEERGKLSAADKAFVARTTKDLGAASADDLERLRALGSASFGQDVKDEFTRRGGGKVADRTDPVERLTSEISALRESLSERGRDRRKLESQDATLDAEAEAGVEKIRNLLRGLARDIEQIEVERAKTQSLIQQAQP